MMRGLAWDLERLVASILNLTVVGLLGWFECVQNSRHSYFSHQVLSQPPPINHVLLRKSSPLPAVMLRSKLPLFGTYVPTRLLRFNKFV